MYFVPIKPYLFWFASPINPATVLNLDNYLFGFVDVAGLIGEATISSAGLMPPNRVNYNQDTTLGLDFNMLRDIGRFYGSYGGKNTPTDGSYYWGFFNLGYSGDWFVQIAHRAYSDGNLKMYRRMFYNGNTWTAWSEF